MKELQADLAVIAAGPAGLAASVAAAESGVSVVVFEKAATTGGTANMGMGPFAVESRIQREMMDSLTVDEAFEEYMEAVHWHVDARLVREYFNKSADTIQWLEDMGVKFYAAMKYFPKAHPTWHIVASEDGSKPSPRCAGNMNKRLTERATELGVQILLETPARKILKDENGHVCGVQGEDAAGEAVVCRSRAVIVATGGFGCSSEMIREYTGYTYGEDIFNTRVPGLTGDGLKMAWEAGAGHSPTTMEKVYRLRNTAADPSLGAVGHLFTQPSSLIVNKLGERVMDENFLQHTAYTANVIDIQKGRCIYAILDDSVVRHFRRHGLDVPSMVHQADPIEPLRGALEYCRQQGIDTVVEADSIEELAGKIGCPADALRETVDEYNRMCEQNYDEYYNKPRKYLHPLKGPKYYAGCHGIAAYGSLGGIKVNYKLEVMDDGWNVMPGFFAAGSDVNTIYDGTYIFTFPGNSMGFAVNTGRMAGEHAADYVLSLEE